MNVGDLFYYDYYQAKIYVVLHASDVQCRDLRGILLYNHIRSLPQHKRQQIYKTLEKYVLSTMKYLANPKVGDMIYYDYDPERFYFITSKSELKTKALTYHGVNHEFQYYDYSCFCLPSNELADFIIRFPMISTSIRVI